MKKMKKCTKCHNNKDLSDFYKSKTSKDGFRWQCKSCNSATSKEYHSENKEKQHENNRKWILENKEKRNERKRKWNKDNPEKIKKYKSKYRMTEETKEKIRKIRRDYYRENKEYFAEYAKEHRRKNRDYYCFIDSNYRASKKNRTPSWADLDSIKDVYKESQYFQLEVDHIIPLHGALVSGLHVWENLQLLTPAENRKKSNNFNIEEQQ